MFLAPAGNEKHAHEKPPKRLQEENTILQTTTMRLFPSSSAPTTSYLVSILLLSCGRAVLAAEKKRIPDVPRSKETTTASPGDDKRKQQPRLHNVDLLKDEDEFWFSRNALEITSLQEIAPTSSPTTLSPSATPSATPTGCSYLIDECPSKCWEVNEDDRPPTCASIGQAFPFLSNCNSLPFMFTECPECCPDACLDDNRDKEGCDPTPMPSPAPSAIPSAMPSECSEVIIVCPSDTCFLPRGDTSRPPDCEDGDPCDVLPQPTNGGCSCCPLECAPDNPMFNPSPDGSPPVCSPTTMPSPIPTPGPSKAPTSDPSSEPSPSPSMMPSECSDLIEGCPYDSCFLAQRDPSRPLDCTDPSVGRSECDAVPPPEGINCPICCASDCRADHPMFSHSPDGSPPECSPTMMPSPLPSPEPSPAPTPCAEILENCPATCFSADFDIRPTSCALLQREDCDQIPLPMDCPTCCPTRCLTFDPDHCGAPTPLPSPVPSVVPSDMPSDCGKVIEQCPFASCFLPYNDPMRPGECSSSQIRREDCDVLPFPSGCPECCPFECRPDHPMFTASEDGSPPVCSPTMMPTTNPSSTPSNVPSAMPSDCAEIIDQCPHDTCFLPLDDESRPRDCIDPMVDREDCNVLPFPDGCPVCCPVECSPEHPMFSDRPDGNPPACSPTMMPSPIPTSIPSTSPSVVPSSVPSIQASSTPSKNTDSPTAVSDGPSVSPSAMPSDCVDVIDRCPYASCFLPFDDPARPAECTSSEIMRSDCNVVPTPPELGCPECCAYECRPNNPMFTDCSPTMLPSPSPSSSPSTAPSLAPSMEPTIMQSDTPSLEPSPAPTSCSYLIDECPEACWNIDPAQRYPACVDFNRPDCDDLPFDAEGCPECCPNQCLNPKDRINCSPTPVPSPVPSLAPSSVPSPKPSSTPSAEPSPGPSLQPSAMPTSCSHLIDECPTACWEVDPSDRPASCASVGSTVCRNIPTPIGVTCNCCPDECLNPKHRVDCSPTPLPSPVPSSDPTPMPTAAPTLLETQKPSNTPSMMPSECANVIERCPFDVCFLPYSDPSRPADCTGSEIKRPDCDVLPFPDGCPRCCPFECRPDSPMFDIQPDGSPPICSPTMIPSPSPSSEPSINASVGPSATPSEAPTACSHLIDECPVACWETDSSDRPPSCASTGDTLCNALPLPIGIPCACCPDRCLDPQDRIDCSPTPLPSPVPSAAPSASPSLVPSVAPTDRPSPIPSPGPTVLPSPLPSPEPSATPTSCSHLIDECPIACWETDPNDRPLSCASIGSTLCRNIPLPPGIVCDCCPDECLDPQEKLNCSPTPVPSPVPSSEPTLAAVILMETTKPSNSPSMMPSECADVIDRCPFDACFLPYTDASRPGDCTGSQIRRPDCDMLPFPDGCPRCCPYECRPDSPMFDIQPNGEPPVCLPTMVPSPLPSLEPSIKASDGPSATPSDTPTACSHLIDECPVACWEINPNDRPASCASTGNTICNLLPLPAGVNCDCCPDHCLNPQDRIDCSPTPLPSPIPSPGPTDLPSLIPSSKPTDLPSPVPSPGPTALPSPLPTGEPTLLPTDLPSPVPSAMPTECSYLIDECPTACFESDPFMRPPLCLDFGRPDCDALPFDEGGCPECCPTECHGAKDRVDCSPTPLPSPVPSSKPSDMPSSKPSTQPSILPSISASVTPTNVQSSEPSIATSGRPSQIPSKNPTANPSKAPSGIPSSTPTSGPTSCSHLIDKCPTACWEVDPSDRPASCASVGSTVCRNIPLPPGVACNCCPDECLDPQDRVNCSPTQLPSPVPTETTQSPSVLPSTDQSMMPSECANVIERCPFDVCFLPYSDPSRPADCTGSEIKRPDCDVLPFPDGCPRCCPFECRPDSPMFDIQPDGSPPICSPTMIPSPSPSSEPSINASVGPSATPSEAPTACSHLIDECPVACWETDSSDRPPSCASTGDTLCNALPLPIGIPCACCPDRCLDPQDRIDCSPTPLPSPVPSAAPSASPSLVPSVAPTDRPSPIPSPGPTVLPSPLPSPEPSATPTSCSHLIDECPIACWETDPNDRPLSCASIGSTLCRNIPLPPGIVCDCCPDECLDPQEKLNCSPTPVPSPVPSSEPTLAAVILMETTKPSNSPSMMPSECADVIDRCPFDACFLPYTDASRPGDCTGSQIRRPDCDMLPFPDGCPRCCPYECRPDSPMFDIQPNGEPPVCLPTMVPSPSPSLEPSIEASVGPSATPSDTPTACSHLIDECPVACWEINPNDRPASCASTGNTICNLLPLPAGVNCDCCPDHCLDPQDRIDCSPTPLPSPIPSPGPTDLPSLIPSSKPTDLPSPVPSPGPTALPSPLPTGEPTLLPTDLPSPVPSAMPTECSYLIDKCPTACFESDPFMRPPLCLDFGRPDCDALPFDEGGCPECCPTECHGAKDRVDCSPTPLPSPVPSSKPSDMPSNFPSSSPTLEPSALPTSCSHLIDECPISCWEINPDDRPVSCASVGNRVCNALPLPIGVPCACCPDKCLNPQDRIDCSPTPIPSPVPSAGPSALPSSIPSLTPTNWPSPVPSPDPTVLPSPLPSPEPSAMPTSCSHLIDQCPPACWENDPSDRPMSCASIGSTVCRNIPTPIGVTCNCCPDECLNPKHRVDCSPTPLPSPVPTTEPTIPKVIILETQKPSNTPSMMPSECANVIERCPFDVCFLPYSDPSRPADCTGSEIKRPDCDVLPFPDGCPRCCPFECRPDSPMFDIQPDGSPPICSPTMMPSPSPSSEPSINASVGPSATPSEAPTACSHLIDECPVACWETDSSDRPPSCASTGDTLCNALPLPIGIPCACCPDRCLDPQDRIDCSPTPLPSPVPSAAPSASPSLVPSVAPTDRPSPIPSPGPTVLPSPLPSPEPSATPTSCSHLIDECPIACWETDPNDRPLSCASIGSTLCRNIPLPPGIVCDCCPDECLDPQEKLNCSPTPVPSPVPSSEPTLAAVILMETTKPSNSPSMMPSECADVIDRCPFDACFLPYTDASRPGDCTGSEVNRPDCDMLPFPDGCPRCCPYECRPDSPMFDIQPNGEPPVCLPTMVPSPSPSLEPSIEASVGPSATPSDTPTACSHLIDECPVACWEINPNDRPASCASTGNTICNLLPLPAGVNCDCCPDHCLNPQDRIDCSPTPLPSPIPSPGPTDLPSLIPSSKPTDLPSPVPSPGPTALPSPLPTGEPTLLPTDLPSPVPSAMPTECSYLIDKCPTACFESDPFMRPPLCLDFGRPDCDALPFDEGGCPECCPTECHGAKDRVDCSPTPLPSPVPSSKPSDMPSNFPSSSPTLEPSALPTSCSHLIDECPISCWEINPDDRPVSCASVGNRVCNALPLPIGVPCACCPDKCLNPQDRIDCSPTPIPSPVPSAGPSALPSSIPSLTPTNWPSPVPSPDPTVLPSPLPSPEPSAMPTSCSHLIDQCPPACWENDPSDRPMSCASIGSTVCRNIPTPIGVTCNCCPDECLNPKHRVDCSPTPLPSPVPTTEPTIPKVIILETQKPSNTPSMMPSECANVIERCPFDVCFLPYSDPSRPADCTGSEIKRPDCDVLPFPDGCPRCCPFECRPDSPMFDIQPDGSPPICSPTMMPSPSPSSEPSINASVGPSATPSEAPTACSHLIDECPVACWETDSSDRPPSCASTGDTLCNALPLPIGIPCACCPDRCLDPQDQIDCSPTPLPSPVPSAAPSASPSLVPSVAPTDRPSPIPSPGPTVLPSPLPSPEPSATPTSCSHLIDECPIACWETDPNDRPLSCASIGSTLCRNIPLPPGIVCDCCPDECLDPQEKLNCSPTPVPSPVPSSEPTLAAVILMETTKPSNSPSMMPSECADVIDRCPFDACFLPYTDASRPGDCTGSEVNRPDCDMLPFPDGCPRCCPYECRPDSPMFDIQPNGEPPVCLPTMVPSPSPSLEPSIEASVGPSATPSDTPTACSHLIDECPVACWEINPNDRPASCASTGNTICNLLPLPAGVNCDCCPDHCLNPQDRIDCSPTPLPSPIPSPGPTDLPSLIPSSKPTDLPSPVPSPGPTALPSPLPTGEPTLLPTDLPSPVPSAMPTECSYLIDKCPTACFESDPFMRPPLCLDFGRPDCDALPFDEGGCPECCPTECHGAKDRVDCSPTPLPSPVPSSDPTPMPTAAPTLLETQKPSNTPSMMPSECANVIERCPFDVCFLPYSDPSRPADCTGSEIKRPDCDVLPFPDGCPRCCPFECRPDSPMFDIQPDGSPPICSPTMMPSPSPSSEPSINASVGPSATPSEAPTACSHLIDECPVACWETDSSDRPPSCASTGDTLCNALPLPIGIPCACCPDRCLDPQDRIDCSPTPLPSPVPSAAPSASPSLVPSVAPTDRPSPIPSPGPTVLPSPLPSPEPSATPTSCSHLINECPIACWETDPNDRPLSCASIGSTLCRNIPLPPGIVCDCCPDECLDPQEKLNCSPTPVPSPVPSSEPTLAAVILMETTKPSNSPSMMPSECADVIDRCPFDACFLPYTDASRPGDCTGSEVNRPDCDMLPFPDGCPRCCPYECRPDSPMFDIQPNGEPPVCLPTMVPSPSPSLEPSIEASVGPSATPSDTPTACSHLIDECPVACWEINPNDRPASCASTGNTICNLLPLPAAVNCDCCPDHCLNPQDRIDCSPTPLPSPIPSPGPTDLPSLIPSSKPTDLPSPVPSPGPTALPSPLPTGEPTLLPTDLPSPVPSAMPTECSYLIDECPTACFESDPFMRPPLCLDFGRPDCDALPFDEGGCPECCPTECHGAKDRVDCSPTPLPSPVPTTEPTIPKVIILETQKPSNTPSMMPSECANVIERCPFDVCFLPYSDPSRPADCTGSEIKRPDCDVLPFPDGCPRCCPFECRPDSPMFDIQPDGSPPICSPTMMPSPSPSSEPSINASVGPSATPSEAPTACSHLIDECPVACWETDSSDRPPSCASTGDTLCNALPLPIGIPCACCPDRCLDPQDRIDCSPTPLPSPVPSAAPSASPSLVPSVAPTDRPSPIPSPGPTVLPSPLPSPEPSATPTSCSHLIDECPIACWETDPNDRPLSCASIGSTLCRNIPLPPGIVCDCCPDECLDPQEKLNCSPTPVPSPVPSSEPTLAAVILMETTKPSNSPSMMPSECADVIDRCPFDACFLPYTDASRPGDCTGSEVNRPDCDMLPFPDGCPRCCPYECRPDSPMFDIQPNGEPPVCLPTMVPSPSPSLEPSIEASVGPSAMPSLNPSLVPSLAPTVNELLACQLNIDIDDSCIVACNFDVCVERPFRMQMRYSGGGCEGTSFKRCPPDDPDSCSCTKEDTTCSTLNDNNSCEDFDVEGNVCNDLQQACERGVTLASTSGCGPPPSDENHMVYIEAFGRDELYFAGPVIVNSTWEAVTTQVEVEAYTDIFTYKWDDKTGKGRLMQHVVFDSSCTEKLVLGDQFGCQQLHEMDSYCQPSCNDGGCIDITEGGLTFGRRRISLLMETTAQIRLDKHIGSIARSATENSVQLEQVLGLYTPVDFSSPSALLNFSDAIGKIVPPSIELTQDGLIISPQSNYSVASIVTGFLNSDRSRPCQQIAEAQIGCRRVPQLPCQCPPCLASQLSTLPPVSGSPPSGEGPPPSGTPPSPSARPPTPQRTTHPTPQPTAASIISSTLSPTPVPPSKGGKGKAKSKGKSGKSKSKGEGKSGKSKSKDDGKSGKSKSKGEGKSGKGKSDSGKSANKSTKGDGKTGQFGKSANSKSTKGKSGKSNLGKSDDEGKSDFGKSATKSTKGDGKSGKTDLGKSDDKGKSESNKSVTKSGKSDSGKADDKGKSDSGKSATKSGKSDSGKGNSGKSNDTGKSDSGKSATKSTKGVSGSAKSNSGKSADKGKTDLGKSVTKSTKGDSKSSKSDSGKSAEKGKSGSGKSATKSAKGDSGSAKSDSGKNDATGKSKSDKSATKSGKSDSGKADDKGKSDSGKSATKSGKSDSGKSNSGKSNDTGKSDSGKSATKSTKGVSGSAKSNSGKSNDTGKTDLGKSVTKSTKGDSKSSKSDSGKSADKGKSDSGKSVTKSTKGDGKSSKSDSGKSADKGKNDSGKSVSKSTKSSKSDSGKSADKGKSDLGKSVTKSTKGDGKSATSNSGKSTGKNDSGKTNKGDSTKNDTGKSSKDDAGKTDTGKIGKWGGKTGQSDTGTTDPFDQFGDSNADSGKTGSGPKGSGKNPVSLPTSAPQDSGKSKDKGDGNSSSKSDSGKSADKGKNDSGKSVSKSTKSSKSDSGKSADKGKSALGKSVTKSTKGDGKSATSNSGKSTGKNDSGKTNKGDSTKNDTGKSSKDDAGKTDTGKIGKWGGKTGQSDTGTTDPFDQFGDSNADSGKTGSGPKGSGKNPVSLPTSAPQDSGKSKDKGDGNSSSKSDSGKSADKGKNDSGKSVSKSTKSSKSDSGKSADKGKSALGKSVTKSTKGDGKSATSNSGKSTGKNDSGKTNKGDSTKNDTGKSSKDDAGKTDTGKIGKWGGKTGQSDTGTTDPFDQFGDSNADSGKTGSGPKGSGKNPVSLPTSAPQDSGKSKDKGDGNSSSKSDSGKSSKNDSGKSVSKSTKSSKSDSGKSADKGKSDLGKSVTKSTKGDGKSATSNSGKSTGNNDSGKTNKGDSTKNDTGKSSKDDAGKTDTGKIGKWGGKTGQSDTGATDPFDQFGDSNADSGKTGSGPKGSGKNPVSLPTSAPQDSGKSKDKGDGNSSSKSDSGKSSKNDSGKSVSKSTKSSKSDSGKSADKGKSDLGKSVTKSTKGDGKSATSNSGKSTGKNDSGKTNKGDSTKNDTGKSSKDDAGKTDTGKIGKWGGKTGQSDTGATDPFDQFGDSNTDSGKTGSGPKGSGKNPVSLPTSAPQDSGKSKDKGDSNSSGKSDSGKSVDKGKSDLGKSVTKSTKGDGKSATSNSGKSTGINDSGKNNSGKTNKGDSAKNDTGKSSKDDAGKTDTGKIGKWGGKIGQSDTGATDPFDQFGDNNADSGKTGSGPKGSGKNPVSLPTSAPKDSGKSKDSDNGKAGKNNSGKDDAGKTSKDDSGKTGKHDTGKNNDGKTGKDDLGKTGKIDAGKTDTGKIGKWGGKTGQSDTGTTDPLNQFGESDTDSGKTGSGPKGSGKNLVSLPTSAPKDSGKSKDSDNGKAGKNNSGKDDPGKTSKDDSGKTDAGKTGKSDDSGKTNGKAGKNNSGKDDAGKTSKDDSGKTDAGKTGKSDDSGKTGKTDAGKTGKNDLGKTDTGKTGKDDSGKTSAGKTGKNDGGKTGKNDSTKNEGGKTSAGKTGKNDSGKNVVGKNPVSPPTLQAVTFENPTSPPDSAAQLMSQTLPLCDLDLTFLNQCSHECRHEVCTETPYRMQMRYNGGGCYGTSFKRCRGNNVDYCSCDKQELSCSEWNSANTCEDFTMDGRVCNSDNAACADQNNKNPTPGCGPPASTETHNVYIEAFGGNELYFSGPVSAGSTWELSTEGEKVADNTDIFTYEWIDGIGKGRILQHVVFHSSCSDDMSAGDRFGSQQLLGFDAFCDVSCRDGGCKEVTENGNTFGRRRTSSILEDVSSLRLGLGAGSMHSSVQLEHVLTMYTPSDFSSPPQIFNFTKAMGETVRSAVQLDLSGLQLSFGKDYSVAAIVTGFLNGDRSARCQQVAQSQLSCEKRATLQCSCPPCLGESLAGLSGPGKDGSNGGGSPTPKASSKTKPSNKSSKDKDKDKDKDKGKNPPQAPKPTNAPLISPPISRPTKPPGRPPALNNPPPVSNKGSGKNDTPANTKAPKDSGTESSGKETKKMTAITRSDGK